MADQIENPPIWVGVLTGRDDVTIVINPGEPGEVRVCLAPLAALGLVGKIGEYAQRQLDAQSATISRYAQNVRALNRTKMDS